MYACISPTPSLAPRGVHTCPTPQPPSPYIAPSHTLHTSHCWGLTKTTASSPTSKQAAAGNPPSLPPVVGRADPLSLAYHTAKWILARRPQRSTYGMGQEHIHTLDSTQALLQQFETVAPETKKGLGARDAPIAAVCVIEGLRWCHDACTTPRSGVESACPTGDRYDGGLQCHGKWPDA